MKWPEVEIRQIAKVASGFGFPREYQGNPNDKFPFFKVGDMNLPGNEQSMATVVNTISAETLKKLKAKAFPRGTIIFPKIGAAIATNKKRMLTRPSVVDNNVMGFIPSRYIDEWYLFYWMLQFDLRSVTNIGPVPSMRKSEVEKIRIPLPTLSEQRRIVEILDQAEALRRQRAAADGKAARILPALFYQMFGDPATNPNGWPTERFDKVVDIGTQLVDPNQPQYVDLPHVGGEQIEKETGRILSPQLVRDIDLRSSKFFFTDKHVLYSKIRPYLNKVAYPRFDGVCSADIYPLLPKNGRISSWYLIGLLRSQAFLSYAKIHSERLRMPKLNRDQLGAFIVPIPDQALLNVFEKQGQELDKLENRRFIQADHVQKLFDVFLHRAFTGDLTATWREAHLNELLAEMEQQARALKT